MMANIFESVFSPLKTAIDLAQEGVELRDAIKLRDVVGKLQTQIIAAQQAAIAAYTAQTDMTEEIGCLKKRVAELEARDTKLERYELKKLPPGVFVYALKQGVQPPEEMHYACEACYQRGKIFRLQSGGIHNGLEKLHCNGCNTNVQTGYYQPRKPAPLLRANRNFDIFTGE
jgi:hypothetical protein